MQIFDASSIIHAWDNYPIEQFPKLWNWLAIEIQSNRLCIANVAFNEVKNKSPDCSEWLKKEAEIKRIAESNDILQCALQIQSLLRIQNDRYGGGVGENDILIIATAKVEGMDLISDEKLQIKLPQKLTNYKIPAVCQMQDVSVVCIKFLELLKQSGTVF